MKYPPSLLVVSAAIACASSTASSPRPSPAASSAASAAPSPVGADAATPAPQTIEALCIAEAPTTASVSSTTSECPDPTSLRVVHRWRGAGPSEPCGPPSWVLHVSLPDGGVGRFFHEPSEQPAPAGERFRPLSDAEVAAAGVTQGNDPLWVFAANDAAPCQATPGRYWVAKTSAGGADYVEIGRALHGCDLPAEGDFVYALPSRQRPATCRYRAMPTARRSGPSVPPTVRARMPARQCASPTCNLSWSLASLSLAGGTVEDAQAVYVFPQPGMPACSHARDWYHVTSWVPRAGAPWVRLRDAGPVTGVIYDGRGVRAVITDEVGVVRVYSTDGRDLGMSAASREYRWYVANEEDSLAWTIQPSCL